MRTLQSTPGDSAASGTGINTWWRYSEHPVPGGGRIMVNVGTGNVVLQADDMNVPHKGLAMAFRRTYNSQQPYSVQGAVTTWKGMYGTGWTNNWDAHMLAASSSQWSVYDIDGGRYDYIQQADGSWRSSLPGQHATLTWDGACGMYWTKKSGTTYYFFLPMAIPQCPSGFAQYGGYAGRLHQIIGRNHNTYLTFAYSWDNGDASPTGKIGQIVVTAESGTSAVLDFGDVAGGRRLQTKLTFPDHATSSQPTYVQYGYDNNGNLQYLSRPPNNAAGTRPTYLYGWTTVGSDSVMYYTASPRWCQGTPSGCGYDGAYIAFAYNGNSAATSTVTELVHGATVNPPINDGTNTPLYPNYVPAALNFSNYLVEFYVTGVATPTFRDTDGHMMNWVVDGRGRPTQTQECTGSTNQGQQCTDVWLITNESWDTSDNLVSVTDPRGNETDYAYDTNGNAIAVAEPTVATSQGTFRPTKLFTYDAYNNVTAYCDAVATHALSHDWTSPPSPPPLGQGLCPQATVATQFQWVPTQDEPFGELTATIGPATRAAPNGYTHRLQYLPGPQGGLDYGLVTNITGDSISQAAGGDAPATLTPSVSFQYDTNGDEVCYSTGSGTWLAQYDALGRQTALADPDDGSVAGCGKPSLSYHTAAYTGYYPDGSIQWTETPVQHAADAAAGSQAAAVSYTYDVDGNEITMTHHHGCATIANCTSGITTKWYDGAERLVEVMQPYDSTADYHTYKWLTRYLHDLSGGGTQTLAIPASSTTSAATTTPFHAYGNLYDTQTYVDLGFSSDDSAPRWVDHLGTAYDAIDRAVDKFDVAIGVASLEHYTYDESPTTRGLLSSYQRPTGETIRRDYDAAARLTSFQISPAPSGAAAPSRTYMYDPAGRIATISSSLGVQSYTYDTDGSTLSSTEPAAQGGFTLTYGYTPNGWKSALSVSGALNRQLFAYSYRPDGRLSQQQVNDNGWKAFVTTFTAGGRTKQRTDPTTGLAIHPDNNYTARQAAATAFQPLTYSYDVNGNLSSVVYSDAFSVNGISTDFEGNHSAEIDNLAPTGGGTWAPTHTSTDRRVNSRGEISFDGSVEIQCCTTITEYANGIQLNTTPGGYSGGPPYRGGVGGAPLGQLTGQYGPAATLNPLDGIERTTSGSYFTNPNWTAWTKNVTYDATGRFLSADLQQCTQDWQFNTASANDNLQRFAYDAESHTTTEVISGAQQLNQNPSDCTFGDSTSFTYTTSWSTTGHPWAMSWTKQSGPYNAGSGGEYMHWDGDTLLFTSTSPSSGVDDIKIGGFAEITTADHNVIVYDRDTSGAIIDAHTTLASTPNVPYNDTIGGNHGIVALCTTYGAAPPCIMITEPKPENLAGYTGFSVQGVRGVDSGIGRWTTPDVLANAASDPAAQIPYMYEGNNPYRYSDPSGYLPTPSEAGMAVANFLILDDVNTVRSKDAPGWAKALAVASIASNIVGPGKGGLARLAVKGLAKVAEHGGEHAAVEAAKGGVYSLRTASGTVIRNGRTKNLAKRAQDHARNYPDLEFVVEHATDDKATQRGLEQYLIETQGGIMDKLNAVSPRNPRREEYADAVRRFLSGTL